MSETQTLAQITVRTMRVGEIPPSILDEPLLRLTTLDPNWVWLIEFEGVAIGMLMACECHGLALLLRVKVVEGAPTTTLLRLLRAFFDDMRERGYEGFFTWLEESTVEQAKFRDIVEKLNGQVFWRVGVAMGAKLPRKGV